MITVTIDGKQVQVPAGTTVLRAAAAAGIKIPTLCDHPKLSPYGGCRLCVVDIEGMRNLQPACTLPVSNNMVVHTDTPRTSEARKFVLTLLFSERNHFCMYCQVSGGDCELQNSAYKEGMTNWPLSPNWTPYPVDASHPYIMLEHNRCILCRRCVRACGELVGNYTLGFEERGAKSFLVADLGTPLGESTCVSCGACVQVCPTGALIDKQSAYRGRDAQVGSTLTTCPGCSVGCGLDVKTRDNHALRIEGNWDAQVNGGVLCEKGRFTPIYDNRERIVTPLVRKDGALKAATWDEAIALVSQQIKPLLGANGNGVVALASPRLPLESLHGFKQVFGGNAGSLEDGKDSSTFFKNGSAPKTSGLENLADADCMIVLGADLTADHQVVGFMVKRALPFGAHLVVVDSQDNPLKDTADQFIRLKRAAGYAAVLTALTGHLADQAQSVASLESISAEQGVDIVILENTLSLLKRAKKPVILFGQDFTSHQAGEPEKVLAEFAKAVGAAVIGVGGGANSLGMSRYGMDKPVDAAKKTAAYVALGDDEPGQRMLKKLESVPFLVVQASYVSPLTAKANVVLPVEMWAEQKGHYMNLEGRVQPAEGALRAPESVLSNTAVIQKLADKMGVKLNGDWESSLSQQA